MAAVTSGGRSEAADELLKEALLAAGNGSGSGGDGDGEEDLEEIRSVGSFLRHAADENRKLWYLAGPAIITSITQYSLGAITQVFAGHLTTLELDAISTENNVIAGLAFGIMVCILYPLHILDVRVEYTDPWAPGTIVGVPDTCRQKYSSSSNSNWLSQRNKIRNLEQASHTCMDKKDSDLVHYTHRL
jgi:MATE family multidrug resistance protein